MQTTTFIDVRYPECDMMQIVHHAVYPIWYEAARMDFFSEVGFSFSDMNTLGVNPAMVDLHLVYNGPATYPQRLSVTTALIECAPRKIKLKYETKDENGSIINSAESFHVWTGPPEGKAYNIAENLPEVYSKFCDALI